MREVRRQKAILGVGAGAFASMRSRSGGQRMRGAVRGGGARGAGRRRCRVPEECPEAVADLVGRCMDPCPGARPSARDIVAILGQPDSMLDRPLPPRRAPAPEAVVDPLAPPSRAAKRTCMQ